MERGSRKHWQDVATVQGNPVWWNTSGREWAYFPCLQPGEFQADCASFSAFPMDHRSNQSSRMEKTFDRFRPTMGRTSSCSPRNSSCSTCCCHCCCNISCYGDWRTSTNGDGGPVWLGQHFPGCCFDQNGFGSKVWSCSPLFHRVCRASGSYFWRTAALLDCHPGFWSEHHGTCVHLRCWIMVIGQQSQYIPAGQGHSTWTYFMHIMYTNKILYIKLFITIYVFMAYDCVSSYNMTNLTHNIAIFIDPFRNILAKATPSSSLMTRPRSFWRTAEMPKSENKKIQKKSKYITWQKQVFPSQEGGTDGPPITLREALQQIERGGFVDYEVAGHICARPAEVCQNADEQDRRGANPFICRDFLHLFWPSENLNSIKMFRHTLQVWNQHQGKCSDGVETSGGEACQRQVQERCKLLRCQTHSWVTSSETGLVYAPNVIQYSKQSQSFELCVDFSQFGSWKLVHVGIQILKIQVIPLKPHCSRCGGSAPTRTKRWSALPSLWCCWNQSLFCQQGNAKGCSDFDFESFKLPIGPKIETSISNCDL